MMVDGTLVRYGATIRLYAVSPYVNQKVGYVGYKKNRRVRAVDLQEGFYRDQLAGPFFC
jgi:hypothetical protein